VRPTKAKVEKIVLKSKQKLKASTKTPKTPKKKRNEPEYLLQCECVEWFNENRPNWILFSVPNEAAFSRKDKFKKSGMLNGAPDLVVTTDKEIFFIELKSAVGSCSEDQKKLHEKIIGLNKRIHVVRNIEHFIYLCGGKGV
jgi:hypothetical protein